MGLYELSLIQNTVTFGKSHPLKTKHTELYAQNIQHKSQAGGLYSLSVGFERDREDPGAEERRLGSPAHQRLHIYITTRQGRPCSQTGNNHSF